MALLLVSRVLTSESKFVFLDLLVIDLPWMTLQDGSHDVVFTSFLSAFNSTIIDYSHSLFSYPCAGLDRP